MDFTWKIFSMTGNVDTYLLLKEMETNLEESSEQSLEAVSEIELDSPLG